MIMKIKLEHDKLGRQAKIQHIHNWCLKLSENLKWKSFFPTV